MADLQINFTDQTIERLMGIAAKKGISLEEATVFVLERTLFGVDKTVGATIGEYKPQHIPIMIDETKDDIKKPFRCITCGNMVFSYYGGVKLISNGVYDSKSMMVEGEERVWSDDRRPPTEFVCQGRVMPEGYTGKVRCGTVYYKIGS